MEPTHEFESEARRCGYRLIAGLDEAGRGPLAGPVVAAAVILPTRVRLPGVTDSKLLAEPVRTKLFEEQHGASDPGPAAFAELPDVFRLLQKLIGDTGRRLNGKLIHVRDDIEKLLSVDEGGTVRRVERR